MVGLLGPKNMAIVAFSSKRKGSEQRALSAGQQFIWKVVQSLQPNDERLNMCVQHAVPEGKTLSQALSAVATILGRHESLRTIYEESCVGTVTQRLRESGELQVELIELGDQELISVSTETKARLEKGPFELDGSLLLRVGMVTSGTKPMWIIIVCSHLVMDGWGWQILHRDLGAALRGEPYEMSAWQPQDQSLLEQSVEFAENMTETLDFWKNEDRHTPQRSFYFPPLYQPQKPRWWFARMKSYAVGLACEALALRYGVTPSAVLVAAFGHYVCRKTSEPMFSFNLLMSNRTTPESGRYVGNMTQPVTLTAMVGDLPLIAAARNIHTAAVESYQYSHYSPADYDSMLNEADRRRGTYRALDVLFNIIPGQRRTKEAIFSTGDLVAKTELLKKGTEFSWHGRGEPETAVFEVNAWMPGSLWATKYDNEFASEYLNEKATTLLLSCDTSYFRPEEIEAVLFGVEAMLVDEVARADPYTPTQTATAVTVFRRGTDWHKVGQNWTSFSALEDMLQSLTKALAVKSFCTARDDLSWIVVFIAGAQNYISPNILLEVLRAKQASEVWLIVPSEVVFCATAPELFHDEESWRLAAAPLR